MALSSNTALSDMIDKTESGISDVLWHKVGFDVLWHSMRFLMLFWLKVGLSMFYAQS